MVISDGLRDRYDALVEAFHRDDKKAIDRLASRESEGCRGQIEGNAICSRRNVEKLAGETSSQIPRDFEEALSLQSGVNFVIAKR